MTSTLRKIHLQKYALEKYTFENYTFEKFTFESSWSQFSVNILHSWFRDTDI